jgi:dihydrofolate synthase/folylpolyglutamate synthase
MTSPEPATASALDAWLTRLEQRHPRSIELGLDRVGRVWRALGAPRPAARVVTVGGTNGKGSTVAFLEAAASACGWHVGTYTSPHLWRYNERIRIDGREADDAAIVAAFERVEAARGDTPLTYFETGTLAALLLMAQAHPPLDLAVLEVGLGGRLDAVNVVDADVAVVTTVALDHQDWLGDDRDTIGREKAGIARTGRPLVVGEIAPAQGLLSAAKALGADVRRVGTDFAVEGAAGDRRFRIGDARAALPDALPLPAPCQWDNAATALAALALVAASSGTAVDLGRAARGLAAARLAGRLQRLHGSPEVIVDVGHNPQAAAALAQWLASSGGGRATDAVFSALADKDIAGVVRELRDHVRHWHVAGLADAGPRGLAGEAVAARVAAEVPAGCISVHTDVAAALRAALAAAAGDERVLVFGSFHTVAEAGRAMSRGL